MKQNTGQNQSGGSNFARLTSIGQAPTPNGSTALTKKFADWGAKHPQVSQWRMFQTQPRTAGRKECTDRAVCSIARLLPLNMPFGLNGLTAVASKTMLLARNTRMIIS